MRFIDRDALMNNWQEKICWGVRCVDCPMLDAVHQCKIEHYFDEQPIIDDVEKRIDGLQELVDMNTERCEELRKQLREAHESYEMHIEELEAQLQKHGEWKFYPIADGMNQCSICGILRFDKSNYCPNCGAKMMER